MYIHSPSIAKYQFTQLRSRNSVCVVKHLDSFEFMKWIILNNLPYEFIQVYIRRIFYTSHKRTVSQTEKQTPRPTDMPA
jgi:hypothetical protein